MKTREQDKAQAMRDGGYIVKLRDRDDVWEITWDEDPDATTGWTFVLSKDKLGDRPIEVGDTITCYGGIGFPIHGVDLNGEEVFYLDELERALRSERDSLKRRQERLDHFEENRDELLSKYERLPGHFQRRIDKFVLTKGPSWWWEFGGYEMASCWDAVLIARAAADDLDLEPGIGIDADGLHDAVKTWFDDDGAEQVEGTSDGHSGNSWGFAKRLAWLWLIQPEQVVQEHGAMVPLVGCIEYGCPHDRSQPASTDGELADASTR